MSKIKYLALLILSSVRLFAAEPAFPAEGAHNADLLTIGMGEDAERIGQKLQTALKADPEWLQSYVRETKPAPGELLPYHEKFGITKEEYATFLEAAKHMSLHKIGDAVVHVQKGGDKLLVRIEGAKLPADTFEFQPDGTSMRYFEDISAGPIEVNLTDESAPTGAWTGNQWVISRGSANPDVRGTDDAYQVKFALGKDTKDRNLIYIRMVGRKSQSPLEITYVLRWK